MLVIVIYFGLGFGLAKLIRRRDSTAVVLFSVIALIVLIINILIIKPQQAGIWTGGFVIGIVSQWKKKQTGD